MIADTRDRHTHTVKRSTATWRRVTGSGSRAGTARDPLHLFMRIRCQYASLPICYLRTYLLIYKIGSWYLFPKVIFRQHFTYLFTHNSSKYIWTHRPICVWNTFRLHVNIAQDWPSWPSMRILNLILFCFSFFLFLFLFCLPFVVNKVVYINNRYLRYTEWMWTASVKMHLISMEHLKTWRWISARVDVLRKWIMIVNITQLWYLAIYQSTDSHLFMPKMRI